MKVYVAGHNQQEARRVAQVLRGAGHDVASSWLGREFKRTKEHSEEDRHSIAAECARECAAADALVLCAAPSRGLRRQLSAAHG